MDAMPEIKIVEYDPRWPDRFELLAVDLRRSLGDLGLSVDHIGSTAVPGLPAKDVIDIQITVASLDREEAAIASRLTGRGYRRAEGISRDHAPPGGETSPEEWRKMYFREPEGESPVHVHVREAGRANQRYPLLFRDYLRSEPSAGLAYAEVKRQLAKHGPDDWDLYYDVKDPVCDVVISAAEVWAHSTGWRPT
jgi:GrpB-like predicted nucleotidyltransferase (UPF0157 family)